MTPARPRKVKEPKLTKGYKKDSVKAPAPMKIGTGGRGILGIFGGKETKREEKAEAKAVRSGKITPKQYAKGEAKEGHGAGAMAKGKALQSGQLSADKYASQHTPNVPKPAMKKGGCVKKYARGGGIEVRGKTKGKII